MLLKGSARPFFTVLRHSLIQAMPWAPVTIAVVYLVYRYPISKRTLPIHIVAAVLMTFVANMFVVLAFGYHGMAALIKGAAQWAGIRLLIGMMIYSAIAAITTGIRNYRDARERELQLSRARLQALNAQIRPHFLFNTLHTIGQLWRSGRNDDAEAVLDRLGQLFQRVNHTTHDTAVPLYEEIDMVRDYLDIEHVRFQDRMRFDIDVPEHLGDYLVPPLILQPIVENAIKHGISKRSSSGRVGVKARLVDDQLVISVTDDGSGFDMDWVPGTGITNTRERLHHHGGTLDVAGSTVTLILPAND